MPKNLPNNQTEYPLHYIMKWLLISVTIFLILATALGVFALIYAKSYQDKFFPGVKINSQNPNGQNYGEVLKGWQQTVDDFIKTGLIYQFNNQKTVIYPTLPATDPDASYELISFNVPETIKQAYNIGRKQGYSRNFLEQMQALLFGKNIPLNFNVQQEDFLKILKNNFDKFITPKAEARPQIDEDFNIDILPETAGTTFDYETIVKQSLLNIQNLSSEPIELNIIVDQPEIKKEDVTPQLTEQLAEILTNKNLILNYEKQSWEISNNQFKNWLIFTRDENNKIKIGLDASSTKNYLAEEISPEIFQPTLDAKFNIENGKVAEFQGSQDGLDLDIDKSYEKITHDFLENELNEIDLVVSQAKSKISTGSVNDLGITEIIGTGHSNFKGSPQNRRHNIAVGAASLNGILLKPGETFSLIENLGEIDADSGYLPELVIKGDKTIPEYGGGLCQIGTTVFRATLQSGLPVIERRNHSYRVSYYEPAGTDATIYDPKPDYKFQNDTKNYVLIQSRIEGDDLYFDFWGTKDNRVVELTDPVIYNITPAGPTVYIETEDLEPGKERCTESAHAGADAYFDYTVIYPDGEIKEERFSSHYIPWQAKCLVGKDPNTATSTPEIIE